jgi:hypothetical protein
MDAATTSSSNSASDDSLRAGERPAVTWTHPKRNLWVASRSGQRVGAVELVAEHFVSWDEFGKYRTAHPDLRLAQRAVESAGNPPTMP